MTEPTLGWSAAKASLKVFHASEGDWGIYIPMTSLYYCADRWFSGRMKIERRVNLALKVLLAHEIVHFTCEYAVAQFEVLLSVPAGYRDFPAALTDEDFDDRLLEVLRHNVASRFDIGDVEDLPVSASRKGCADRVAHS